jgi:hypothetical protein
MVDAWAVGIVLGSAALGVGRELIALRRHRQRRSSVERVIAHLAPGSRLVDRDRDGAVVDVTIDHATSASLGDHRRDRR